MTRDPNHISRRNFIRKSSLFMSTAMMSFPHLARSGTAGKYKMGLQLFTIRDAMAKDAVGSIKKVADIGYRDLETYGLDAERLTYYGHKAAELREMLINNGLTTSSGHYDFSTYFDKSDDSMRWYVDQCIAGATALGQSYVTWPWLAPEFRTIENYRKLAEKLNRVGEQINTAGLGFAYHNHDYEFLEIDGEIGYDIITTQTDSDLVKLQLDLYWAMHSSKLSPAKLIARHPGRYVMWHIKDMDKITRDYTELGNGSIDYTIILPEAKNAGLEYYFLEQGGNYAKNSMQSIADSAKFFRKNLERFLT